MKMNVAQCFSSVDSAFQAGTILTQHDELPAETVAEFEFWMLEQLDELENRFHGWCTAKSIMSTMDR